MTKYFLWLAVFLAGCGQPTRQLNLFIWSEYIDPKILRAFEQKFNCKINVDLFEDSATMLAKLAAGGSSTYDLVVPSNSNLPGLVQRGLLAPLRPENIPNLVNLDPQFSNRPFNPSNQFGAPYQWGTTGLFVRKPPGKPLEESWALIFDPAKQPGPFLLIDEARHCIGAALKFKGHSLNSTDPKHLAEARDLLVDAKRRSLGFEGTVGGKNRVLAQGAAMAFLVNGDAARGMGDDPGTYFFAPREGSEIFLDLLSVPAKAPHRALAEAFINFILDPKIGAQLSNFNQFGTPNQAALPFITPADLKNPALYPAPDVMRQLEYANDLGEANKLYDELWTEIKTK